MDGLKESYASLAARHDALSRRERGMILAALLALVYTGWDSLIQQPLAAKAAQTAGALGTARSRLQQLQTEATVVRVKAAADPDSATKEKLARLAEERRALEQRRSGLAQLFIAPRNMAPLLKSLLEKEQGLRLVSLATLPPQPLGVDSRPADKGAEDAAPAYRHGLALELEGGYFDLLHYLRALENQPVFWRSVDYQVKDYPKAAIRLEVFTLSFQAEWLGV